MDFEWDETKRKANLAKHGVDFEAIERFRWDIAMTREDTRTDYQEARFVSASRIDGRLHVAVWTVRDGNRRLISLRKANKREEKLYG